MPHVLKRSLSLRALLMVLVCGLATPAFAMQVFVKTLTG